MHTQFREGEIYHVFLQGERDGTVEWKRKEEEMGYGGVCSEKMGRILDFGRFWEVGFLQGEENKV